MTRTGPKPPSARNRRRQSPRLLALRGVSSSSSAAGDDDNKVKPEKRKRAPSKAKAKTEKSVNKKRGSSNSKKTDKKKGTAATETADCLPRARELELLQDDSSSIQYVFGVDEAGRGPLAGPVVAAAAYIPESNVAGIVDSKKITSEQDREDLYETLVKLPDIQWAVAIMDTQCIDEINILQATLKGMTWAAEAIVNPPPLGKGRAKVASIDETQGSYVVVSDSVLKRVKSKKIDNNMSLENTYALIDGNRLPKNLKIPAETMVKGDSREYGIAAASILAKVTRDRLMHAYDKLYPEYNLKQHKGYPTAAHMAAVTKYGASPIHRRTFAPLKHMEFDENGKIIGSKTA